MDRVNRGDPIKSDTINGLIEACRPNFSSQKTWIQTDNGLVEYQDDGFSFSTIKDDGHPWYADSYSPMVYRPYVYIDNKLYSPVLSEDDNGDKYADVEFGDTPEGQDPDYTGDYYLQIDKEWYDGLDEEEYSESSIEREYLKIVKDSYKSEQEEEDYFWIKLYKVLGDSEPYTIEYYTRSVSIGGGSSSSKHYGTFRFDTILQDDTLTGRFSHCNYQFGRGVYTVNGQVEFEISDATDFYLKIPHSYPQNGEIVTEAGDGTNLDQTVIPIISVDEDGKVTSDYRGMPTIPVWGGIND